MTILGMPTATMVYNNTITTFTAFDPFRIIVSREMVRKVIPDCDYRAGSSC
jgi:hypothetical protein